jgi:hypothetical protein
MNLLCVVVLCLTTGTSQADTLDHVIDTASVEGLIAKCQEVKDALTDGAWDGPVADALLAEAWKMIYDCRELTRQKLATRFARRGVCIGGPVGAAAGLGAIAYVGLTYETNPGEAVWPVAALLGAAGGCCIGGGLGAGLGWLLGRSYRRHLPLPEHFEEVNSLVYRYNRLVEGGPPKIH